MKKRLLAILLFATTIASAQVRQEITLSEGGHSTRNGIFRK